MPDKDASLMARCPECDSRIYFGRKPDTGQIIVCPECETSLEIISANPIRLDWAYDEGERPAGVPDDDPFGAFAEERDPYEDGEEDDDGY
jgi:lysine biosynthesis protein LysW